jgi:hypothetical protein
MEEASVVNADRRSASSRTPVDTWPVSAASAVNTVTVACPFRPVRPGEVGDRDQGFPGVGGAVLYRDERFGAFQLGQAPAEPHGQYGGEGAQNRPVTSNAVRGNGFAGRAAPHPYDDRADFDGVGHRPDPGQGGHGEGRDLLHDPRVRVVAIAGRPRLVAGVEQPA